MPLRMSVYKGSASFFLFFCLLFSGSSSLLRQDGIRREHWMSISKRLPPKAKKHWALLRLVDI